MGSWTNATARPGHSGTAPERAWTRQPDRTGLGNIVHPQHLERVLHRDRLPIATPSLRAYCDYHWTVRWAGHDLPLRTSEVITDPVCHLTFEAGTAADGSALVRHGVTMPAAVVTSVWTGRFVVELSGAGRVFGVRFRPGALAALIGKPVPADGSTPAAELLPGADELVPAVLNEPDDTRRASAVEQWLAGMAGDPDPDYLMAAGLVERVRSDPGIVRVEQIGSHAGLSVRGVQRLFRFYIGVSPKWVLMRCRLKDAAAALDADPTADQADLAIRLGWYDQSHFVRDFRRFLSVTPGRYAAEAADADVGGRS